MQKLTTIFLFVTLFFTQIGFAQSWFSESSNWYNNYTNFSMEGYAHLYFESDTTIQGIACKKFAFDQLTYDYVDGINYNFTRPSLFFTEANDVVQLYIDGTFKTIINMNAEVGDSWTFDFQSIHPNFDLVEVLVEVQEKDNLMVNGISLKRMNVLYTFSYRSFGQGELNTYTLSDILIERVGNNNMFIDPREYVYEILDLHSAQYLRCYSDQEIGSYEFDAPETCDFVVSTSELQTITEVRLAPNPTSDQFVIDAASPVQQVECYSMQGQLIQPLSSRGIFFSLRELPAGLYWLHVRLENGEKSFHTIVKQ